jgi:hypothetical protein
VFLNGYAVGGEEIDELLRSQASILNACQYRIGRIEGFWDESIHGCLGGVWAASHERNTWAARAVANTDGRSKLDAARNCSTIRNRLKEGTHMSP